ncbi:hypothetical protein EC968_006072 [Mortierella alpina]|nr:hypothetical protein EC968_006072 [Mortierella alpina]
MAMLSSHMRSKSHLAQLHKLEDSQPPAKTHAVSAEPQAHSLSQQDVVMKDPDDPGTDPVNAHTVGVSTAPDARAGRAASPCSGQGTTVKNAVAGQSELIGRQTAKQRKRKMERDRKRTRGRMDLSRKNTSPPRLEIEGSLEEVPGSNGLLHESEIKHPVEGEALGSLAGPSATMSGKENSELPQTTQHEHWSCTLCKTVWTRQKAWQGHLLSAQHMRRLLRTMHDLTPPIRPTGTLDVLASMDPFGWGTGVGFVEEEEEEEEDDEEEEEEGDGVDRAMNTLGSRQGQARINMDPKDDTSIRESEGDEDDDNMDLGE